MRRRGGIGWSQVHALVALVATATAGAAALTVAPAHGAESAIGRLNHAGYRQRMHCTATLIAPDRVLTAAHCVRGKSVGDMHFLPGYDRARWREDLRPRRAALASAPRDTAILCLAQRATSRPLALSKTGPAMGERLVVVGYPAPRVHAQTRIACTVARLGAAGAFALDCPVNPGGSGAPVLRVTHAREEVVGVISATTDARSLAFDVSRDRAPSACD